MTEYADVIQRAVDALVAYSLGEGDGTTMDDVLREVTPRYNRDPEHTRLWHDMQREVDRIATPIITERRRLASKLCAKPGCQNPSTPRGKYCGRRCALWGARTARKDTVPDDEIAEMVRMYVDKNMSSNQIADRLGRHDRTVTAALRREGVRIRGRWETRRLGEDAA